MPLFGRGTPSLESDTDTLTRPVEQEDDGGHDRFALSLSARSGSAARSWACLAASQSLTRTQS